MEPVEVVCGLIILVGLVGIAVPVLPGLALVWVGVLVWASERADGGGFLVLAVATVLAALGFVLQYSLPGRRLRAAGVGWQTTLSGVALGIVGFFVVPVVGLFLGFVLGIYLAERLRLGSHVAAGPSTKLALKAVGLSIGIELVTGLLVATTWIVGVILT
ncbi:MAG TPA: DUF456 domain-containing protein [Dermatophilaceae bacterium]|nr:DUF456 domain-containing protein [Dermatophilaceae bacterium]